MVMKIKCSRELFDVDAWAFALFAFVYTLAWNWQHHGPAYLSDAVAYMVNAAILAGHHIDAMGSWHAGYSMVLWPLFWLDDPALVWKGVLILNAGLVAASVLIASRLVLDLEPEAGRGVRSVVTLLIVIYPSFSAISGYGYASPLLTPLVMVIFRMLLVAQGRGWGFHGVLAVLLGFTYWVHPIGVVLCAAATLAYAATPWASQQARFLVPLVVVPALMVVVYKLGIHPWMYDRVTPAGFPRYDHYSVLTDQSVHSWLDRMGRMALIVLGQFSYQVVASFGVVAVAMWSVLRLAIRRLQGRDVGVTKLQAGQFAALLFAALSLLGVVAAGGWTFSWGTQTRIDHWIYGRYTDSVVLPLLVYGYVLVFGKRPIWTWSLLIFLPLGVLGVGVALSMFADPGSAHSFQSTLAFWPSRFWAEGSYLAWFALGAAGIFVAMAACLCLGVAWRAAVLMGLAGVVAGVLGVANFKDHQSILTSYSKPSAVVDIVRAGWPRGSCVGFVHPLPAGLALMQRERYRMYAFYLFNYRYQRQTVEQWQATCDGPLFSYSPQIALKDPRLVIFAREVDTGLYLIVRSDDPGRMAANSAGMTSQRGGLLLASEVSETCLIAGCFAMPAIELASWSQVGTLDASRRQLASVGRVGFLFYGPYRPLEPGAYRVRLQGNFSNLSDVLLDVVSEGGTKVHAALALNANSAWADQPWLDFVLPARVASLEVRMRVGAASQVSVSGYQIERLAD